VNAGTIPLDNHRRIRPEALPHWRGTPLIRWLYSVCKPDSCPDFQHIRRRNRRITGAGQQSMAGRPAQTFVEIRRKSRYPGTRTCSRTSLPSL